MDAYGGCASIEWSQNDTLGWFSDSLQAVQVCKFWDALPFVRCFKFFLTRFGYLEILHLTVDLFHLTWLTCLFGSSLVHFFEFGSWLFKKRKKAPSGGGHVQCPAHWWSKRPKKHTIWRLKGHNTVILTKAFRTKSLVKFNAEQMNIQSQQIQSDFNGTMKQTHHILHNRVRKSAVEPLPRS